MSEILEAEAFSRELDKLLDGKPVDAAGDAAKDLEFAAAMSRSDYSAESRIKRGLKTKLLARPQGRLRAAFSWMKARPVLATAFASLLVVLAAPSAMKWLGASGDDAAPQAGWGARSRGVGVYEGSGSSAYEPGTTGLAPGAAVGGTEAAPAYSNQTTVSAGSTYDGDLHEARVRPAPKKLGGMQNTFVLPPIPGEAAPEKPAPAQEDFNREGYDSIVENPYLSAADNPLSTFSIDVDAASYANVRRILGEGRLPPKDAVRVEELVNYFHYDYPEPTGEDPFSITAESADCPWNAAHKLVRIGLKGKAIAKENLPPNNLVFLIDSSGSMMEDDKLPLLKRGLRLLVDQMRPQDRITIATYAGEAGLVLPATPGDQKEKIVAALEGLEAGGSTAGGEGIKLAYELAAKSFIKGGVNRAILATDGDFNVGVTSDGELVDLIERERDRGVFLTVLGFGRGNYQDAKMKKLADKGNGNYAYVDDIMEARRVLVREMGATLMTIAKDVKIQVEFNPARVQAYRLIGYESRLLKAQDFNDDKKDAGELGAGHTVTALYEIVPAGAKAEVPSIDPLKYQKTRAAAAASATGELLTVKFRYKKPDGDASRLIVRALDDKPAKWSQASPDFRFAAAAAGFGMLLRGSPNAGDLTYEKVRAMARQAEGADADGYRSEFVRLVEKAGLLANPQR